MNATETNNRPLRIVNTRIEYFEAQAQKAQQMAKKMETDAEIDCFLHIAQEANAVANELKPLRNELERGDNERAKKLCETRIEHYEAYAKKYENIARQTTDEKMEQDARRTQSEANTIIFELKGLLSELRD